MRRREFITLFGGAAACTRARFGSAHAGIPRPADNHRKCMATTMSPPERHHGFEGRNTHADRSRSAVLRMPGCAQTGTAVALLAHYVIATPSTSPAKD
jgi:hypothetical protein